MKATATSNNIQRKPESQTPIDKAVAWLRDYERTHPCSRDAEEARTIASELRAVRNRPALDDLLALLAQIAKTDQGFQEITRAKRQIRRCEPGKDEET